MTQHIAITVDSLETALRTWLARLDYDLHKAVECSEDGGIDTYPQEAAELFALLRADNPPV